MQLESAILLQIDSGSARPGDQLPSEREISEMLCVSARLSTKRSTSSSSTASSTHQAGSGHVRRPRKTAVGRYRVSVVSRFVLDRDQQTTVWLGTPRLGAAPHFAADLLRSAPGSPLVSLGHFQMHGARPSTTVAPGCPADSRSACVRALSTSLRSSNSCATAEGKRPPPCAIAWSRGHQTRRRPQRSGSRRGPLCSSWSARTSPDPVPRLWHTEWSCEMIVFITSSSPSQEAQTSRIDEVRSSRAHRKGMPPRPPL
ncbi:GntR family transcriptional regulator [Candidatus Bathyarchaeota archaeon]|nr:GntR family transcriptional regulator [Candidatus Bathyarchaeota archaeon]